MQPSERVNNTAACLSERAFLCCEPRQESYVHVEATLANAPSRVEPIDALAIRLYGRVYGLYDEVRVRERRREMWEGVGVRGDMLRVGHDILW